MSNKADSSAVKPEDKKNEIAAIYIKAASAIDDLKASHKLYTSSHDDRIRRLQTLQDALKHAINDTQQLMLFNVDTALDSDLVMLLRAPLAGLTKG